MIPTVPDTVETSSNLAIITIGEGKAAIKILARSSSDSMKEYLTTSLGIFFLISHPAGKRKQCPPAHPAHQHRTRTGFV